MILKNDLIKFQNIQIDHLKLLKKVACVLHDSACLVEWTCLPVIKYKFGRVLFLLPRAVVFFGRGWVDSHQIQVSLILLNICLGFRERQGEDRKILLWGLLMLYLLILLTLLFCCVSVNISFIQRDVRVQKFW